MKEIFLKRMPNYTLLSPTILSVRGKVETRSHSVVWAVLELTLEPFWFAFCCYVKHHGRKQLGEERIPFTLHFTVHGETSRVCSLLLHSWLPYITLDHVPRGSSTIQQSRKYETEKCTGQSDGGGSSTEVPSGQACQAGN